MNLLLWFLMTLELELKRYAAYFRGWCQAFGEHQGIHPEGSGNNWLLTDHQVGLVLPKPLIKPLYREVLLRKEPPTMTFSRERAQIGSLQIALEGKHEKQAVDAIGSLLAGGEDIHLFLTSHLLYGSGNRIITFSSRKPLSIIYKEIGVMHIRLL